MKSIRHAFLATLTVLSLQLLAGAGLADIAPPISLHLVGDFAPAEQGQPFTGTFRLRIEDGAWIDDVFFAQQPGWELVSFRRLPHVSLEYQDFVIQARPLDPDQALALDVIVDGRAASVSVDLSPRAHDHGTRTSLLGDAAFAAARQLGQPSFSGRPGPPPRRVEIDYSSAPSERPRDKAAAPRTVTVQGIVGVTRNYEYDNGPEGDGAFLGLPGAAVYLYEASSSGDNLDLLESGYTDDFGNFSLSYFWDPGAEGEDDPDLTVVFALESPLTSVVHPTSRAAYTYRTATSWDFAGGLLDLHGQTATAQIDRGRMSLFVQMQRARQFFLAHGASGDGLPPLPSLHPNGGPSANSAWANFPDNDSVWVEYAPYHESGHHWAFNVGAESHDWTYCNPGGYCDGEECGHCQWCEEDEGTAFNEGLANWIAYMGPIEMDGVDGIPLWSRFNQEHLDYACGTPPHCDCDPLITEGQFGATLVDISDDHDDNQAKYSADVRDPLNLGIDFVMDVLRTTTHAEATPELFIRFFKSSYPQHTFDLWETAANNGYDFDVLSPMAPIDFGSSSHPEGVHLWDQTVDFQWDLPTDDWSGPAGYSIHIGTSVAAPDTFREVTDPDATTWTSPTLAPGTWYASIRTVDRAGHWSGVMATYGPIHVEATDPLDLAFEPHTGWAEYVVPRMGNDATGGAVAAPTELRGDGHLTYGNLLGVNDATIQPSPEFDDRFILDGTTIWSGTTTPVISGSRFSHLNRGPFFVSGGRHVFAAEIDYNDDAPESNEGNNLWGKQWVWQPGSVMVLDRDSQYPPPPRKDGGWDAVDVAPWYNVRGARFLPSGYWTAVILWPHDPLADHDLKLHPASTGPENGFTTYRAWSSRPEGCTDAVFINRNVEPAPPDQPWDVGVLAYTDTRSNSHLMVVESGWADFGTPKPDSLDVNEMLDLFEFQILPGQTGWINLTLRTQPDIQPLRLNLLGHDLATGDLHDGELVGSTDPETGIYSTDLQLGNTGYYAIAVYRDAPEGNEKLHYTLTVGPSSPELAPFVDTGWAGAIVPRSVQDLEYPWENVPIPFTLLGDIQPTFAYVSLHNTGPIPAGVFRVLLEIDGEGGPAYDMSSGLVANGVKQFTTGSGFQVAAGRHTLGMVVDALDAVGEPLEDNNTWARSWYWSPPVQDFGTSVVKPTPPDRFGGWEEIPDYLPKKENFATIRTPQYDPAGGQDPVVGIAYMPHGESDYGLVIAKTPTNTTQAFSSAQFSYGWGPGGSDFILVDFDATNIRQFDVGTRRVSGSDSYRMQVLEAIDIGHEPFGPGPVHTLGSTDILHLFRMNLEVGDHRLDLESLTGNIDWGMSLYPRGRQWSVKSNTLDSTTKSWESGPGLDEGFDFNIDSAGEYVVAVWKTGLPDLDLTGSYRLHLQSHVSDVPGIHASGTRIREVSPNPLNPHTTIDFAVAKEGGVKLGVYSLRGELVRLLVDEDLGAGIHSRTWDGMDSRGQTASSGIYVVRLLAGGEVDHHKVTLLK